MLKSNNAMTFYGPSFSYCKKNINDNESKNKKNYKKPSSSHSFKNLAFNINNDFIPSASSNSFDSQVSTDIIVDNLLHSYEEKFCSYSNVKIFVTTFNVNGKSPPETLYDWLYFDSMNMPDVIVIGLQEMDLALGTYVIDSSVRQDEWLFVLKRNIPNIYKQVSYIRLIGIFMVVYSRQDSKFNVSQVNVSSTPTGFLKFGNKGGVGMSLRLNDTLVCFLNSHLAAGNHELSKRNQDFREISQMRFANGYGVYDHEVVFWLGDLNYRLNMLNYEEVVRECNSNKFLHLFCFDQLKEQQRLRIAFNGFHEEVPNFRPTYKFDVGTTNWDTSEKRRVPAWCDRILYWTRDKSVHVKQLTYNSIERITFSDHKPVFADFNLTVKLINEKKRTIIYEDLLREGDKRANELLPQISLSQTDFNFGDIIIQDPSVAFLLIKNIGLTPTRFVFTLKHQPNNILDDWLTITPKSSFLDVGTEIEVSIQVCLQNTTKIVDSCKLSCILVVGLDHGRDYFVVVSANYNHLRPLGRSESVINFQTGEKIAKRLSLPRNVEDNTEISRAASLQDDRNDWLIDL